MSAKFEILQMPPTNTNSILVSVGTDCVIFDAWGRADDWENFLTNRGLNLIAIYTTHGHADHISAAPELSEKRGIPWYLHHNDLDLIPIGNQLLDYFNLSKIPHDYKKPENISMDKIEILPNLYMDVFETPGHSSGGVIFYFASEKILIIGDTLFQDSVGRYDLPGANRDDLFKSISKIYNMNMPDDTLVIHGHGGTTRIGELKRNNIYFKNH